MDVIASACDENKKHPVPIHRKLIALDTEIGSVVFADYYRFGASSTKTPLIIYVGGAINQDEYLKRLESEPLPILTEFKKSFEDSGFDGADLLVIPFPPEPDGRIHQQLFSILLFDLLTQTDNPRPPNIACVGFSLGAAFASYLTFSLKQVKALATLGGYGMVEAANESRMVGDVCDRYCQSWWNEDSTGYMENLFFLQFLTRHDATMDIITGSGGHAFSDYALNGSIRDAFGFVLKSLQISCQ